MKLDQVKRLKELVEENGKLKWLVAELSLESLSLLQSHFIGRILEY